MICKRYENKVALVTGGASGIGRATVKGLVGEGAKVVFTDITRDAGVAFETELKERGGDAMFVASDATREDQVESLISTVVNRYGRLDIGINNVGNLGKADQRGLRVHDSTLAGFNGTLEMSLVTNFLCMKYEIAQMLKQGGGVIANTTSLAGIRITPHSTSGYVAAKAGVVHLTRYAAVVYAKDNIRVNVVAPGFTATPAMLGGFPDADERNALIGQYQPMVRMLSPEELADAFLWVCSDQASGVTGLTIPVDGGWAAK